MSILSREELQSLARRSGGPHVSLYLPTHRAGAQVQQNPIRFKNLLRQAEDRLLEHGHDEAQVAELLAPAQETLQDSQYWQHQSDGLAVFLGPEGVRRFRVPVAFEELVLVGERFHLTPLLPFLTGDGRFHVLAVSQNRVRLFEGSRDSVREIDLRDLPESLTAALGYDWEERSLQFRTGVMGGGQGKRRAMYHGHGAGSDDAKEEITRFLQLVDGGLNRLLRDRQAPLVVAAVEYLIAIYREVTQYPNLAEQGIEGNPDALTPEELHAKAWQVVEPLFQRGEKQAAERFRELLGTGRASGDLEQVVPAAVDGRVDTLFVAVGAHQWGRFDVDRRRIEVDDGPDGGNEDLLDRAALESLLHGATVYAVEAAQVPGQGRLAAVFRY